MDEVSPLIFRSHLNRKVRVLGSISAGLGLTDGHLLQLDEAFGNRGLQQVNTDTDTRQNEATF